MRADVRAPVPADLRLVVDAAQADAHELPPHRPRDRLPERGLADARRADEAEDRLAARLAPAATSRRGAPARPAPLPLLAELPHREVLDDPILDLLEIVVVLVEDRPRASRSSIVPPVSFPHGSFSIQSR